MKAFSRPVMAIGAAVVVLAIAAAWIYWAGRPPTWVASARLVVARAAPTDLNGDGKSDLLFRNSASGLVYRFFMNGLARGEGALVYNEPNTDWRIVADADFNGDGVTDLLWRNSRSGQLFISTVNTSGVVARTDFVYSEPDTDWQVIHTPDFDGNGKADLLYWNSRDGRVFGILMDGFTAGKPGFIHREPNLAWRIVAVGDFAGTGKKNQLLYRNSSSGHLYMMTLTVTDTGFTQTGEIIHQEPNTAWQIIAAADFDGDRKTDILWRNETSGHVHAMLMNGGRVAAQGVVHHEADPAWQLVATGDYDGDGKADLLWRNASSGLVHVMLLNGLAVASQGVVYKEPNIAWRVLGPSEYAVRE